jgi:hypothetical protein
VLQELHFRLDLNGTEIGTKMSNGWHGLKPDGFLTDHVLRHIGVDKYTDLWGKFGKVVKEARKMLRDKQNSTELMNLVARCARRTASW